MAPASSLFTFPRWGEVGGDAWVKCGGPASQIPGQGVVMTLKTAPWTRHEANWSICNLEILK